MKLSLCFVLLLSSIILAQQPHTSTSSLKRLLVQQGFTGELQGKVAFSRLGILDCGSRKLEVFYYSWEESHPPGLAIHASYRVILLEHGNKYVGSYHVADPPARMTQTAILFNYSKKDGNTIACEDEDLPQSVMLDGESEDLFR